MSLIRFVNAPTTDYEGIVTKVDDNIVQLNGCPKNVSGFGIYNPKTEKLIADYSEYTYFYRQLGENIYQYSNNGEPYDPKQNITVSINWNDDNDSDGIRPDTVNISLRSSMGEIYDWTLTKDNWSHTFTDLSTLVTYTLNEEIIEDYKKSESGFIITYTHNSVYRAKETKKSELDTACTNKITQGIEYDGHQYVGNCKEQLEIATQTFSKVEFCGQELSSSDLNVIYIRLSELDIYEHKYCELLKELVDRKRTIEAINDIHYGDELPSTEKAILDEYIEKKNKVIEFYAHQLYYANADDLSNTQEALFELYEMIINLF